jgi:uncharacterized protein YjiS (DUF1127 family)
MNTETTYDDCIPAASIWDQSAPRGMAAALWRPIRRIQRAMLRYHWERHTVRELSALPSYVLRDIGLRPDDIHSVAAGMAKERAESWARQAAGSNGFSD